MRTQIAKIAIVVSLVAALGAGSVFGEDVELTGTITPSATINATATGSAGALDLTTIATSVVKVADYTESSNNGSGYTVTIKSQYGGLYLDASNIIDYNFAYVSNDASEPTTFTQITTTDQNLSTGSATTGTDFDLYIQYTIDGSEIAGDYADTITLTITNNS